jgi:hypothetical protein
VKSSARGSMAALPLAILVGCSTAPQPASDAVAPSEEGAIALARKMRVDDMVEVGVWAAYLRNAITSPKRGDSFQEDWIHWCSRSKGDAISTAQTRFAALCRSKGGAYAEHACRASGEADIVLFYARLRSTASNSCSPFPQVTVTVIEPTKGTTDPTYMARLSEEGYATAARRQEMQRNAQLDAQQQAELARHEAALRNQELAAELPRMRRIGARVCRAQPETTFVGFVESMTDEKLQIRVVDAFVTRTPRIRYSDFRPHITWDYPANWRLCE